MRAHAIRRAPPPGTWSTGEPDLAGPVEGTIAERPELVFATVAAASTACPDAVVIHEAVVEAFRTGGEHNVLLARDRLPRRYVAGPGGTQDDDERLFDVPRVGLERVVEVADLVEALVVRDL
jgi:hypothetical protein